MSALYNTYGVVQTLHWGLACFLGPSVCVRLSIANVVCVYVSCVSHRCI